MSWKLNNKVFVDKGESEIYYGFVYLITFLGKSDIYPKGTIYVGKKAFSHRSKTRLSKKAKLLPENKGKRVSRGIKDSGWKDYFGSSKELSTFISMVGKEHFSREILRFSKTKAANSFHELKAQIEYKVMEIPSFNKWIGGRIFKSQLTKEDI